MFWKTIKVICMILMIGGFLWAAGTIGADDLATMRGVEVFTWPELLLRCAAGMAAAAGGAVGYRYAEAFE